MTHPWGIVLGSGLGSLVERAEIVETIPYFRAGLPSSGVPGHEGAFMVGRLGGVEVVIMRGRVHLYEGHDARTVTAGVRWMAEEYGVGRLVLTNAAGSLRESAGPGSWMLLEDQLNLTGASPLEGGANFVDMSEVYDAGWREDFAVSAAGAGMDLHAGVYAGLRGPQYETPAEIRMLRAMGADAVGMSTVLEAIQARALGMRVLGLSCLTNLAAGLPGARLDHEDVTAVGQSAAGGVPELLGEWMSRQG